MALELSLQGVDAGYGAVRALMGEHLPDVRPDYRALFSAQKTGAFDLMHDIDLAIWFANQPVRREGIAIMEIDPDAADFGKILMDIPLPPDLVAHHIFFNRDRTKAYLTALNKSLLHVVDLTRFPYRLRAIEVPDCLVGEDLVVSEDNRTWYLTCMGSSNVIMGDARVDKPIKTVSAVEPAMATILYPHGIAIHNGIDRVLVTSTVKPDMSDAGESITVMEAGSGRVLS